MRFRRIPRTEPGQAEEPTVELDTEELEELTSLFAAPPWLRNLGISSWLLVGVTALIVGLVWILGLTSTIVEPVLGGLVLAVVASPGVTWFKRRGVPRAAGALFVLLGLVALGVVLALLVVSGIKGQSEAITQAASSALETMQGWLEDAGVEAVEVDVGAQHAAGRGDRLEREDAGPRRARAHEQGEEADVGADVEDAGVVGQRHAVPQVDLLLEDLAVDGVGLAVAELRHQQPVRQPVAGMAVEGARVKLAEERRVVQQPIQPPQEAFHCGDDPLVARRLRKLRQCLQRDEAGPGVEFVAVALVVARTQPAVLRLPRQDLVHPAPHLAE